MTQTCDQDSCFDPAAWDQFCQELQRNGQQILANTPDNGLDQTEGFRYLARLTHHALGRFVERSNPLKPGFDYNSPRIGGDNPDFLYGSANISGAHNYRIYGNREQVFNIGIGSYYGGLGSGDGLKCSGYIFLNELLVADNGDVEIIASQQHQPGNWLPLFAESNSILLRQTVLDRRVDRPAELQIELLEPEPVAIPPQPILDPASLTRSLQLAALFVSGVTGQFIGWSNNFKQRPNEIHPIDPTLLSFAQGDPGTHYHNGYFELAADEALVVELEPPNCEYWNIQVANHWLESLDYLDYQTHLNHATAVADADGRIRLVISAAKTGAVNRIDTAGHQRGCISMRWVKADRNSQAKTRRVKLAQLEQPLAELMS